MESIYPNPSKYKFSKNLGHKIFNLGIFLLPSAFVISSILLLIATLLGYFFSEENIFSDKLNKIFLIGSILIMISGFIKADDFINISENFKIIYPDLGIFNWIPLIFSFFGFQTYLRKKESRKICALFFLFGTVPVIISVLGQVYWDWDTPMKTLNGLIIWYLRPIKDFNAASGLFNNPNYLGSWLNIIWPFCLSFLLFKDSNNLKKSILFIFSIFVIASIFLCSSRAALLCLILSIPIFLGREYGKWFIYFLITISSIFLLIFIPNIGDIIKNFILEILPNELLNNFRQETYANDISRLDIWNIGIGKIIENPIWGSGSNSFPQDIKEITGIWKGHSHNLPIELILNYGIPAGLFILLPFTIILSRGLKKIFFEKNSLIKTNLVDRAWIISLLLLTLSHIVDITYYDGRISIAGWILLAGIRNIIKEN